VSHIVNGPIGSVGRAPVHQVEVYLPPVPLTQLWAELDVASEGPVLVTASDTTALVSSEDQSSSTSFALDDTGALVSSESTSVISLGPLATLISADSPVGWWRLGETSGTVATDIGTANNNGTYTGGFTLNQVPLENGDANPSITFDGSTGYVNVADNAAYSIPTTDKLTVVAVVQFPTTAPTGIQNIVAKGGAGGNTYEWALRFNGRGIETVAWGPTGATITAAGGGNIWSTAQWASDFAGRSVLVAFTFDNTIAGSNPLLLYINKITPAGSGAKAAVPTDSAGALNIGRRGDGTGYLGAALVEDVAIFDVVLSTARIYQYADALLGIFASPDTTALASSDTATALPSLALTDSEALGSAELAAQSVVYPSWGGITDTFDTPGNWFISANAAVTGGRGTLSPLSTGANGANLTTQALYDLTGASVSVQYVQVLNQVSGAQTSLELRPKGLGTNTFLLILENGFLYLQSNIGGTYTTLANVAWDAPNMLYWRIRESNGSLYGEVSPDGSTWTEVGHWRYLGTPITVTDIQVNLGGSTWKAVASPGTAIVDNLNVFLTNITPSDSSPVTSSESSTLTTTQTATDSEALTTGETNALSTTNPASDSTALSGKSTETSAVTAPVSVSDTEALSGKSSETGSYTATLPVSDTEALVSSESQLSSTAFALSDSGATASSESASVGSPIAASDSEALVSSEAAPVVSTTEPASDSTSLSGKSSEATTLSTSYAPADTAPVLSVEAVAITVVTAAANTGALVSGEVVALLVQITLADSGAIVSGEATALLATMSTSDAEALVSSDIVSVGVPVATTDSTAVVSSEALSALQQSSAPDSTTAVSSDAVSLTAQRAVSDSEALVTGETMSVGAPVAASESAPLVSSETRAISATSSTVEVSSVAATENALPPNSTAALSDTSVVTAVDAHAILVGTSASDTAAMAATDQSSVGSPISAAESDALLSSESSSTTAASSAQDIGAVFSQEQSDTTAQMSAADSAPVVSTDGTSIFRLLQIVVADSTLPLSSEQYVTSVLTSYADVALVQAAHQLGIEGAFDAADLSLLAGLEGTAPVLSNYNASDSTALAVVESTAIVEYAGKGYPEMSPGRTRADVLRPGRRTASTVIGATKAGTKLVLR
jgi:hypothetical protein